ncbi:hypothetical protein AS9A_0007 [Hoyosella subflava DQS3-9A1]|uniref:Uncharacterized protein n=1 Tax=Hoyosella subflava (strain DSM 45089 / JCM 17490 / NBRC 109087 / DQS3-9A1) TaxID=443218 RepID=F6ERE7_HOYSD|nr:hypothetical protein AS9A_0007 [Hoyosella subflava DQS3-9A1]
MTVTGGRRRGGAAADDLPLSAADVVWAALFELAFSVVLSVVFSEAAT